MTSHDPQSQRATVGPLDPTPAAGVASVRDLAVSFTTRQGQVQALRTVSLEVARGEIIALVGESGSGKSVLGQSLLGLISHARGAQASGSVHVAGVDMLAKGDRSRAVRRHVLGAVFQDPLTSLNPTTKIGRQLTERGITRARAIENLHDAGVPDATKRADQFPHELSGGLRQRVAIAMALGTAPARRGSRRHGARPAPGVPAHVLSDATGEPQLIVADEPTTALDVSVQAQVVLLFDRLRREHGCAVLFVTHDLGVAASIADRIAVLYAGRICEIGPAADLLLRPTHWYTRALLQARISVDTAATTAVRAIPGAPPNPLHLPPGCPFEPRCPNAHADCRSVLPHLTPRPKGDGRGEAACLHPNPDHGESTDVVGEPTRRPQGDPAEPASSFSPVGKDQPLHPTRAREPALELRHISKSFRLRSDGLGFGKQYVNAVADVSLAIPQGGSFALVGESGCGKTTTLRIACGLLSPNQGEVKWSSNAGRPQLVFQDAGSSLTPWMTIGAMLSEQLGRQEVPRRSRRAKTLELLVRVGLDERAIDAKPRDLSGGQRQRAAIARSLAAEPRVLICDEPVSALDASLAIRVLDLLHELRQGLGVALLVVTHDLGVARRIADQVAVMYRGEIVEQGPTDTIFATPAHPYTEGLLAAIPSAEPGRLSPKLSGEPPSPIGTVQGCSFRPRCPYAREVCVAEAPPLAEVVADWRSACHFAGEVLAGTLRPSRETPV